MLNEIDKTEEIGEKCGKCFSFAALSALFLHKTSFCDIQLCISNKTSKVSILCQLVCWSAGLHIISRVQELCESRGGRPGLSVLMSLTVSVDVKLY